MVQYRELVRVLEDEPGHLERSPTKQIARLQLGCAAPRCAALPGPRCSHRPFRRHVVRPRRVTCVPTSSPPRSNPMERTAQHRVDSGRLQAALDAVARDVRARRLMPKPFFEARDRTHRGSVTRAQFRGVLDSLGVAAALSPEDMQVLLDAFALPEAKMADKVNYVRFCVAVDPDQKQ